MALPPPLVPFVHPIWSAHNALAFRWRRSLGRLRGASRLPALPAAVPPADLPDHLRALWDRHGLHGVPCEGEETSRDLVARLDLLVQLFGEDPLPPQAGPLSVLDVGAKNWHDVGALHRFLARRHPGRDLSLTGLELDPHVVYGDLKSRGDWARAYARGLPGCRFVEGDVREHRGTYDLVTVFHPFVEAEAHLEWGLPLSSFDPVGLLRASRARVAPGGTLAVVAYASEGPALRQVLAEALPDAPPLRRLLPCDGMARWGLVLSSP